MIGDLLWRKLYTMEIIDKRTYSLRVVGKP